MNQLDIHKKIDEFLKDGIDMADVKVGKKLISSNDDAKRYFFFNADETWLEWLWKNKFLDDIKRKANDTKRYSYQMPELGYLEGITSKAPAKIATIIFAISISNDTFNPEVIDRFLRIVHELPAKEIKVLTVKIRDEHWAYLMREFNQSGYEYRGIVKKLSEAKEFDSLLEIAEAILNVKNEEKSKHDNYSGSDNYFYIREVNDTKIFEALAQIDGAYAEQALELTTRTISKIFKKREKESDRIFDFADLYRLYDINFFKLELNDTDVFHKNSVRNLVAVIKKLIEKIISNKCENSDKVKQIFDKYISSLPNTQSMWRLRLFTLAQCPDVFKNEIKEALFKVFNVGERYFEITDGVEYQETLICSFNILNHTTQREYVKKVFEYFLDNTQDKDVQKWRKRDGGKILLCISKELTTAEKKEAKKLFGVNPNGDRYKPEPRPQARGGSVRPRSHVNLDNFSITEIIEKLKTEWIPEKLKEQFQNDDFLNPRGVEGLGDALKEDVKKRTPEYLDCISKFFARGSIDPYYLYSILRGIEDMLRDKKKFEELEIAGFFQLFNEIKKSGESKSFKRKNKDKDTWLADWITVHKVIADIMHMILFDEEIKVNHKKYRDNILGIIKYLLTIMDSPSKQEEKPEYGGLHHIVINSVRGQAYKAFIQFTYNDGEKLHDDVKQIFKDVLNDKSLVIRFIIGHYLASLYFRDKIFITKLFKEIFPKDDPEKKDVYLATWEGYLTNTIYEELFEKLSDYYQYAITLEPKKYTERKYEKGLDETLAIHFALAFTHLKLEMKDPLFKQFWDTPNTVRHSEFVSFIGRHTLTRGFASDEWLKENKVSKEKLVDFWSWILQNPDIKDPKIFANFGYWINNDKEILKNETVAEKMNETLKKSGGNIDWNYGLLNRIKIFAKIKPDDTIEIIKRYLLKDEGSGSEKRLFPFGRNEEIKEALKIIYTNGDAKQKQKVVNLVNTLIEEGSSMFWGLKEAIE